MEITFAIIMTLICVFFFICSVIYRNDNTDKRYVLYGGREFYCWCEGAFSGSMCCVSIYEYFPKKLFKNRYRAYKTFWVDDYETIKEGIYAMIESYIKDEEEEMKIVAKWKS
jgi:hypothetical protein